MRNFKYICTNIVQNYTKAIFMITEIFLPSIKFESPELSKAIG